MPGMDIGHVHLRVSDLDRSVAFYRDVLGSGLAPGSSRSAPRSATTATIAALAARA